MVMVLNIAIPWLSSIGATTAKVQSVLTENKGALESIEALLTSVALLVGGWWTYRTFIRTRLRYPRIDLEQRVSHRHLPDGRVLLRVVVTLKNHGSVLLRVRNGFVRVQQVLPVADIPELGKVRDGSAEMSAVVADATELPWPLLIEVPKKWADPGWEVEPGETETVAFDIVLRPDVEVVRIYSFIANPRKRRLGYGWKAADFYDIRRPGGDSQVPNEVVSISQKSDRIDRQDAPENRPMWLPPPPPVPTPPDPRPQGPPEQRPPQMPRPPIGEPRR